MSAESTVVSDYCLYQGRELSEEEIAELKKAAAKASARVSAARMAAASGASERQLRQKLCRKGVAAEDAKEAVDRLVELGFVDDEREAKNIVRRCGQKGYGKMRARQELAAKGIPREFWDDALSELSEPDEAIDSYLQKSFRGTDPDEKSIKRVTDALCRRGHTWSDIKAGLARYREGLEEILEEY